MMVSDMQKAPLLLLLLILAPLMVTLTDTAYSQTRPVAQARERTGEQSVVGSIEQKMAVPEIGEAEQSKKQPIVAPGANGPAKEIDKQLEGTGLIFLPGTRGNAVPEEILEDKNEWQSIGLPVMDAP